MLNEKKYEIPSATNKYTNNPIYDDEPVFLIRAKDNLSINVLNTYMNNSDNIEFQEKIDYIISCFKKWRYEHQSKCKDPD